MKELGHNFFYLDGYGGYVLTAYAAVFIFLLSQWLIPWYQFRKNKRNLKQQRCEKIHEQIT